MNIRIDLLDASERRHQGAISPRFIVRLVAATLALIFALVIGFALYSAQVNRHALQQAETVWGDLRPRLEAARAIRKGVAETTLYLSELEGWRAARFSWKTALEGLQRSVPAEAQLIRMEALDDVAAARPKSAEETPMPYRRIRMKLNGRAAGERPEDVVARLASALRGIGAPQSVFSSVTLAYIQADPLQASLNTFELEATGEERPLKAP